MHVDRHAVCVINQEIHARIQPGRKFNQGQKKEDSNSIDPSKEDDNFKILSGTTATFSPKP